MIMTIKLPDELMNQLSEFDSHAGEIIEEALKAGAEISYKQAKANLSAAVTNSSLQSTGQLKSMLGISPVKPDDDGWDIRVGFAEPRQSAAGKTTYKHKLKSGKTSEYQLTNAMVANVLEYGRKGGKQRPRPFMKPAADATKNAAKKEIKRVFDEEANKYLKSKG